MTRLRIVISKLSGLFKREQLEQQLDDEVRAHLGMLTEENERKGMTAEEARQAAMRVFGNVSQMKEECRDTWGVRFITELGQDLRYGLRQLRRNPGFTAVAVLTLALGIGANTAIFSVLNAVVLRPLPVRDPSSLVEFYTAWSPSGWAGITVSELEDIAHHQSVFTGVFGQDFPNNSYVDVNGATWRINLGYVTGRYFSVLGIKPMLGRVIAPYDVGLSKGAPTPVAVLSYDFWTRRFAGNRNVIGKTIFIAGSPFTIIGVTAKGFFGTQVGFSVDVTVPVTEKPRLTDVIRHPLSVRYAVARLRKGVTLGEARAQLETLWPGIRAQTTQASPPSVGVNTRPRKLLLRVLEFPPNGASYLRDRFSKPLYVIVAIAGLILLITCVNLASMLFARASAREHEMAIRTALGAGRWRLMRQLLTEGLFLSTAGAVLGLAFAFRASGWLVEFWKHIPFNPVTVLDQSPDLRVLGFAIVITVVTTVLFALAPAWHASHQPPTGAMQEGSRGSGRNFRRFGKVLITSQVAFSVVLVTTGGLLVRSFVKLRTFDPGFDYQHAIFMQLEPRVGTGKINDESYCQSLLATLSTLPAVRSVALSQMLPGLGFGTDTEAVTPSSAASNTGVDANTQIVSGGFFKTLDIPLLQGRDFRSQDDAKSPPVAIISKSLADRLFPSGDAVGNHIRFSRKPKEQSLRVIGIVGDARIPDLQRPWPYIVYVPYFQRPDLTQSWTNILIRVEYISPGLFQTAREKVDSLSREYVLMSGPAEQLIDTGLAGQRAMAYLAGFFLALALLLAAIGLYGLMAYTVVQRTREIGIRMALGARRSRVLLMILRESLWLVVAGLLVGLPCALASSRFLAHMLFDLSPYDPITLLIVILALIVVALGASYIPARRAAKVDPMVALRYE